MNATKTRRPVHVWLILLLPPASLGVLIFAYVAVRGLSPAEPDTEAAIRGALPAILAINHLGLFGLLVWLLHRDDETLSDIGWSLVRRGRNLASELIVGLLCGLGLYLLKELAVDPVRQLVAGQSPTFTSLFNFRTAQLDVALAAASTGLVFVEESIYRGYALPFLAERWGTLVAVLVTSLAFGPLHWGNGLGAILFASVWGMLLAGIFLWRRNLVAGTVAHALYNLMVLLT
jgi:membrane protease YdiL (CAAX protease family)